MPRPSIAEVSERLLPIIQQAVTYTIPPARNKGLVGQHLETLLGIPTSSATLDCSDGEVKCVPLKRLRGRGRYGEAGDLVVKETCAVTMLHQQDLQTNSWGDSKPYQKLAHTLFVWYLRDGDNVQYLSTTLVTPVSHPDWYTPLLHDYDTIRRHFGGGGGAAGSSRLGTYLQTRTKGAGGTAPKTRAWYLRKAALEAIRH